MQWLSFILCNFTSASLILIWFCLENNFQLLFNIRTFLTYLTIFLLVLYLNLGLFSIDFCQIHLLLIYKIQIFRTCVMTYRIFLELNMYLYPFDSWFCQRHFNFPLSCKIQMLLTYAMAFLLLLWLSLWCGLLENEIICICDSARYCWIFCYFVKFIFAIWLSFFHCDLNCTQLHWLSDSAKYIWILNCFGKLTFFFSCIVFCCF